MEAPRQIREEDEEVVIGRVTKGTARSGEAEFIPGVRINDLIFYRDGNGDQVVCRVTRIQSAVFSSANGHYTSLKPNAFVPPEFTQLYKWKPLPKKGAFIYLGVDGNGNQIHARVNDVFHNTLIAGKHGQGKTQLCISIAEQLITRRVPLLIVDTQDEFTELKSPYVQIFNTVDGIIGWLKERGTAILSLGGLSNEERNEIVAGLLAELKSAKELDYKKKTFKFPPTIVMID